MKWRIRKLINNQFVVEYKRWWTTWRAVDAKHNQYSWVPGDKFYVDCWVKSEKQAQELKQNHMAWHGMSY